jgi:mRNA deadenylase 3'-5' endonuclease subunit Ccr4
LYGLRTSGARWAEKLADSLQALKFFPSHTDPAIWMREQKDHWEYIGVYVDNLLIMSKNTDTIIKALEKEYTLKGVGFPKYYLGADMQMLEMLT